MPLTAALQTLPAGDGHREDVASPESIAMRMRALGQRIPKPWIAVVDAGALFDPMARLLVEAEIPTFRAADRAQRLLNIFCAARLRRAEASQPAATTTSV